MNCFAPVKVLLQIPPAFYLLKRLSSGFIEFKLKAIYLPFKKNYSIGPAKPGMYFALNVHPKQ